LHRPRAGKYSVRDDGALNALVLVIVRGDEAGHDDRSRAVDDFRIGGGDRGRDLSDRFSVDQDVSFLEIADAWIETQDDAALQQDAAPSAVADQVLDISWRRRP